MSEDKKIAFMKLYEPVHPQFERFCKARVYGQLDFKDLMHDTIIIAFNKLHEINDEKAFLHYLFGTAIREKTDIEKNIELEHLKMALSRLPDDQRETLLLFEIAGFSIKEISSLQQIGESAVKQRLSRGRQNLLVILSPKSITL